jgi:hypothetical protein
MAKGRAPEHACWRTTSMHLLLPTPILQFNTMITGVTPFRAWISA